MNGNYSHLDCARAFVPGKRRTYAKLWKPTGIHDANFKSEPPQSINFQKLKIISELVLAGATSNSVEPEGCNVHGGQHGQTADVPMRSVADLQPYAKDAPESLLLGGEWNNWVILVVTMWVRVCRSKHTHQLPGTRLRLLYATAHMSTQKHDLKT